MIVKTKGLELDVEMYQGKPKSAVVVHGPYPRARFAIPKGMSIDQLQQWPDSLKIAVWRAGYEFLAGQEGK